MPANTTDPAVVCPSDHSTETFPHISRRFGALNSQHSISAAQFYRGSLNVDEWKYTLYLARRYRTYLVYTYSSFIPCFGAVRWCSISRSAPSLNTDDLCRFWYNNDDPGTKLSCRVDPLFSGWLAVYSKPTCNLKPVITVIKSTDRDRWGLPLRAVL
jgi:hypothetical protein